MFDNLLIVDAEGNAVRVRGARKLRGVGPFWGYNLFLNQRIAIDLAFEGETFKVSADEVKSRTLDSLGRWRGWASREDFEVLRENVMRSASVGEIIELVALPDEK